jgi:hypothetical protein
MEEMIKKPGVLKAASILLFKIQLGVVPSSIASSSTLSTAESPAGAGIGRACFAALLDAFWQWIPALVVIILLSLRPVKTYFRAQK